MLRKISLNNLLIFSKLHSRRNDKVYDNEWKLFFDNEEKRKEFISKIKQEDEEIKNGNVITQQEMEKYIEREYGIHL